MKSNKLLIAILLIILACVACGKKIEQGKEKLYVYNWGLYIDESVIDKFEEKYNCDVIYDTFDTNEEMYAVVATGARVYDVLCPTDYMIGKMINQGLLYEYDIFILTIFRFWW